MPDFVKCTDPDCWVLKNREHPVIGPHCHPVKAYPHLRLVGADFTGHKCWCATCRATAIFPAQLQHEPGCPEGWIRTPL